LEAFSYSVSRRSSRAPPRSIHGYVHLLLEDSGSRLDTEGLRLMSVVSGEARRMGPLRSMTCWIFPAWAARRWAPLQWT
jgi:hypothetical protein